MSVMQPVERRKALAEFLRTRRARLTPQQVGLPEGLRRRTAGLRREEVALLANVGITWYTWLEQERDIHVSSEVLNSIASALALNHDERRHLFLLADQALPPQVPPAEETISPNLRQFVDALAMPCYVIGRRWDRIAWNKLAGVVFGLDTLPPRERNIIWRMFTNTTGRQFMEGWTLKAQWKLAQFRSDYGQYLGDPWFEALISDLQAVSPEFCEWWPRYDLLVPGSTDGPKTLNHPLVGRLTFNHMTFQVPNAPTLKVVIYTPLPGEDMSGIFQTLLGMAATHVAPQ
jgi:transcriptional regulator with XRE-family HTH domain